MVAVASVITSEEIYNTACKAAVAVMAKKDFRAEYIEGLDRSQKRSTVFRRDGGCAVIVDHRMFVWGGQSEIEVYSYGSL